MTKAKPAPGPLCLAPQHKRPAPDTLGAMQPISTAPTNRHDKCPSTRLQQARQASPQSAHYLQHGPHSVHAPRYDPSRSLSTSTLTTCSGSAPQGQPHVSAADLDKPPPTAPPDEIKRRQGPLTSPNWEKWRRSSSWSLSAVPPMNTLRPPNGPFPFTAGSACHYQRHVAPTMRDTQPSLKGRKGSGVTAQWCPTRAAVSTVITVRFFNVASGRGRQVQFLCTNRLLVPLCPNKCLVLTKCTPLLPTIK